MISTVGNYGTDISQQQQSGVVAQNGTASGVQDMFMKLMVASMQYQDPLDPQSSSEWVSQMSQMAMMESNENLVGISQANQVMLDNLQVLSTTTLVGKTVDIRTDTFKPDGEGVYKGSVDLQASSNTVTIEILDETGEVVKSIPLGANGAGSVDFEIDAEELELDGTYTIEVRLDEGQSYKPETYFQGEIESVVIPADGTAVMVDVAGIGKLPFYELHKIS
ncbi:flagellar hook capping FlgD N-terminal domain-containing protein [Vibrio breoganii]|uniref:flagellar hook capping FlgD N-terminal domain-containing protein n=1 Tax=Vibrio breoganii TaxID=553239 RepID=UPI000C83B909|nr:flagellar hook capping FlgD N-terminal domain-containing protein [Vibrio breoganii]